MREENIIYLFNTENQTQAARSRTVVFHNYIEQMSKNAFADSDR